MRIGREITYRTILMILSLKIDNSDGYSSTVPAGEALNHLARIETISNQSARTFTFPSQKGVRCWFYLFGFSFDSQTLIIPSKTYFIPAKSLWGLRPRSRFSQKSPSGKRE